MERLKKGIIAVLVIFFGITICAATYTTEEGLKLHGEISTDKEDQLHENGVYWTYDDEKKTLYFDGKGYIFDYSLTHRPLWEVYKDKTKYIVIGKGITQIGDWAFCDYNKVEKVVLPEGITQIGNHSFAGCDQLKTVSLPKSLKIIEESAFASCYQMKQIELPPFIEEIGPGAFDAVYGYEVVLPQTVKMLGVCSFWNINEFRFVGSQPPKFFSNGPSNGFAGAMSKGVIYVPEESYELYVEALKKVEKQDPYKDFVIGEQRWEVRTYSATMERIKALCQMFESEVKIQAISLGGIRIYEETGVLETQIKQIEKEGYHITYKLYRASEQNESFQPREKKTSSFRDRQVGKNMEYKYQIQMLVKDQQGKIVSSSSIDKEKWIRVQLKQKILCLYVTESDVGNQADSNMTT